MANLDAAWTDALLATASFGAAGYCACRDLTRWMAPAGLGLLGLAALVGVFRLGGIEALGPLHDNLSRLAGLVGLPLAATAVAVVPISDGFRVRVESVAALAVVGLTTVALVLEPDVSRAIRTVVSGTAMVAAIGFSIQARNPTGVLAPVLVLIAGLGIAGEGTWLGFDRMGWFHLVMAAAAGCFGWAATRPSKKP